MAPNTLSATDALKRMAAHDLTSEGLVAACLDRIAEREPSVRAWSHIDPETALKEARACDASPARGALHGIPVAVKDVIDAVDMPTGMGSPIYDGYRPLADAACVAALREAGAVILGKTVTAEFAGITPGPTRNPLALARTPGGSSSGSAAALADWMAPVAFGTQTGGSILRPASYCGIIGFKPSYNAINRAGLKFAAESFDTIGLMARDLADIVLVWRVLVGRSTAPKRPHVERPRFALFRTQHWHRAAPETVAAVKQTVARLADRGAIVEEIPVPDGFDQLSDARKTINNYERARALAWEWQHHRDRLSPGLADVVADGWSIPHDRYLRAIRTTERWRAWLADAMDGYDAIITAAVDGEAPEGLASTGSAAFQEVWTMLHTPSITLPLSTGPNGLPVGVQFVGRRLDDEALLSVAGWVMQGASAPQPHLSAGR